MNHISWRRRIFKKYLRHFPRVENIRGTWLHQKLGDRLFHSELWQLTRWRFAGGMAVGAFFALMPAPFQMLAAGLIAYFTRVNVPTAIAATWISNPLTFPFFAYIQYRLGLLMMGREPSEISTFDLIGVLQQVPVPFLLGAFPAAVILSAAAYSLSLVFWDFLQKRKPQR